MEPTDSDQRDCALPQCAARNSKGHQVIQQAVSRANTYPGRGLTQNRSLESSPNPAGRHPFLQDPRGTPPPPGGTVAGGGAHDGVQARHEPQPHPEPPPSPKPTPWACHSHWPFLFPTQLHLEAQPPCTRLWMMRVGVSSGPQGESGMRHMSALRGTEDTPTWALRGNPMPHDPLEQLVGRN